jgi:hypothetical protein
MENHLAITPDLRRKYEEKWNVLKVFRIAGG